MSAFIIQLIGEYVPAPILWAAAGAVSCCGGLNVGLYFMNPVAFQAIMAEEHDEDAQDKAMGPATLEMFQFAVLISALVNGCVSFYGFDRNVSLGCCGLECAAVGSLTAWYSFQDLQKVGQDLTKERNKKQARSKSRPKVE